jgi:hypothetical protein
MSASEHSAPDAHAGAPHDSAEELAHAQRHAIENIWFFAGFFGLILLAVASYELTPNHLWEILILAALRAGLIAGFFAWLLSSFSFMVRTIIFTVFFLGGMILLSMWDSTLPGIGNPIVIHNTDHPH